MTLFACSKSTTQDTLGAKTDNTQIVYEFSDSVNAILFDEISYEIKIRGDTLSFDDFCLQYFYCDGKEHFKINTATKGHYKFLAENSNRVTYIKGNLINICFESDMSYSTRFKKKTPNGIVWIEATGYAFELTVEDNTHYSISR